MPGSLPTASLPNYSDAGVSAHQVAMKLMYMGAVIDQLDLPLLSWAELACRPGQMVELKYKHKFVPVPNKQATSTDPFDDARLYLGLSSTRWRSRRSWRGLWASSSRTSTWPSRRGAKPSKP